MSTTPVSHKGRIEIPSLDVILEQERAALASIADARARQKVAIEAAQKDVPEITSEGTRVAREKANDVAKSIKNQSKEEVARIGVAQEAACEALRAQLETNFNAAVECALKLVTDSSGSAPC